METIGRTPPNLIDLLCRIAGQGKEQSHDTCCTCPACTVLQCLERPRYFSGQLLTDAELTGEQDYVRAKMQLHNRFLHGCGVVCGLQVSCHQCEGWVNVHQGYAIDCCGNDIVVCDEHPFDVIGEIKKCQERDRQQRTMDCRPLRSPNEQQCQDIDQYWCLTLRYEERESRPTTTLRGGSASSCSCGGSCGCGGNGCGCGGGSAHSSGSRTGGCGCGGNGNDTSLKPCGCSTNGGSTATLSRPSGGVRNGVGVATAACEPTRILEGYRLELCKAPAEYCGDPKSVLDGTLLQKIAGCLCTLGDFLGKRIPTHSRTMLTGMYFAPAESVDAVEWQNPAQLYESCCRFRQAVYDLYVKNPLNVRCQAFHVFDGIVCPPPPQNQDFDRLQYFSQVHASIQEIGALLVQYALDCVCASLLPSCAPDPCDDRLILACMTVRNDEIVKICNWSCRTYAGSFPAMNYWLSLVPVLPYLRLLIERLCCTDWIREGLGGNRLGAMLDSVDPSGRMRESVAADNFALPKHYMAMASELLGKFSPASVSSVVQPRSVNLPTLVGDHFSRAESTLKEADVRVHEHQIASAADVPTAAQLRAAPFAAPGETVTIYTAKGKVVGYGAYDPHEEVRALRTEVASLRDTVARIRRR